MCKRITAGECLINTTTSIENANLGGSTNGVTNLNWTSSYTLNSWCMQSPEYLNFTLEYSSHGGDWKIVSENDTGFGNWQQQLYENQQFSQYQMFPSGDVDIKVRFTVDYNGKAYQT